MRTALVTALAILLMLLTVESVAAQPRIRGVQARMQRAAPAPADVGYFARYVTGPGGTRIPVREVPGSTTVITRQMMDDFQARSVCDALRFAPGVTVGGC